MPNLGMLGGEPCPFRWKDMLRDMAVGLVMFGIVVGAAVVISSYLPKHPPNTIKITYELHGVQRSEIKPETEFGPLGLHAAVAFGKLQNDEASRSVRPLSRVVALEYCPRGECNGSMKLKWSLVQYYGFTQSKD